jgi:hypothetical protein
MNNMYTHEVVLEICKLAMLKPRRNDPTISLDLWPESEIRKKYEWPMGWNLVSQPSYIYI